VFPVLRDGQTRIREQEARVLFCGLLNSTAYYYAVEAPTTQTYSQSGDSELSARTDLAMYTTSATSLNRAVNVEFKAKNPAQKDFTKDVEKLIREALLGNWFHLLENTNRGTLPSISNKFVEAFIANQQHVTHDIEIVFTVCILQTKRAFTKQMLYSHGTSDFVTFIQSFFANIDKWDPLAE